jgi:hypothetical protein
MKKEKLIPPDINQCQADKPNGNTFMTFGGIPKMVRCRNVPEFIAMENNPKRNSERGSMSVCRECSQILIEQLGLTFATFKTINRRSPW